MEKDTEFPPNEKTDKIGYHIYCLLINHVETPHLKDYIQNSRQLISVPRELATPADLAKHFLHELSSAERYKVMAEIMQEKNAEEDNQGTE